MGNHHSQTVELNPSWSHSFPRDREKKLMKYGGIQDAAPARKVLPERVPGQKLRLTTNGNILQQGGTISGRRLAAAHSFSPLTDCQQPQSLQAGLGHNRTEDLQKGYDSEPDLRDSAEEPDGHQPDSIGQHQTRTLTRDGTSEARARSRKKSRAPPPPPVSDLQLPPPPAMPPPPVPGQPAAPDGGAHRPRARLFKRHGEGRRPAERRSPHTSRALSEQRWLPAQRQMQERKARAQSIDCIRAQTAAGDGAEAADQITSFGSLPRPRSSPRTKPGELTRHAAPAPGSLLRPTAECSRSEGTLQAPAAVVGIPLQQAVSTERHRITITVSSSSEAGSARRDVKPNMFYFGMEPAAEKRDDEHKTSALAKVKRNEYVAFHGSSVSYSRRTASGGHVARSPSSGRSEEHTKGASSGRSGGHAKSPSSGGSGGHAKSPSSGRSGGHAKSPSSGRSGGHAKSPSSGRSGGHAKRASSGRTGETAGPPTGCSPANLARIPSRKLADFVSSLERNRQKRLSVSRDEMLTNSSALSCQSQSSVFDLELEAGGDHSISMHLRPTLPRKQLEIPRFSPLSAWRSLTLDHAARRPWRDGDASDAGDGPTPLTAPPGRRRPHTKSADSGISGDASSPPPPPRPLAASSPAPARADGWVPAHDLDMSSGGEEASAAQQRATLCPPQLMSRADMFPAVADTADTAAAALSGRSERHPSPHTYNSLRQMKRTVSTAIAALRRSPAHSIDDNWLLSRSVPNSLNGGDEEAARPSEARSDGGTPSGRHVLYLPEYHSMPLQRRADRALATAGDGKASMTNLWRIDQQVDPRADQRADQQAEQRPHERRDDEADERREERRTTPEKPPRTSLSAGKRKFSYQSTVRQLERRRLEARLSRLAEEEEQQRLKELHILQQVEQQFQRKRAREQAERQLRGQQAEGPHSLSVSPHGAGPAERTVGGWRDGPKPSGEPEEPDRGLMSLQVTPYPPPVRPGPNGPTSLPVLPGHRTSKSRDKPTFLSGVRNWIRARKEVPRGPESMWQVTRLEPEGAPASAQQDGVRQQVSQQEGVRQEVLSAARHRSGRPADKRKSIYKQVAEFTEDVSDLSGVNSPVSELSTDQLPTSSGYESSPPLSSAKRLTQELSEYRQQRRDFRDYRAPAARHQSPARTPPFTEVFGPSRPGRRTPAAICSEGHDWPATANTSSEAAQPVDPYAKSQPLRSTPMPNNYRRTFAQGSAASLLVPHSQPEPQPEPEPEPEPEREPRPEPEPKMRSPATSDRRKQRMRTPRRNDSFKRSLGHQEPAFLQPHPVYAQQRQGYVGHVNSSPARFMHATEPFPATASCRPGYQRSAPPAMRHV